MCYSHKLHHEQNMNQTTHFHTQTQILKYTRKNIYTQIQENMGTGANGKFYNT